MEFHPRNITFFYITVNITVTTVLLDVGKILHTFEMICFSKFRSLFFNNNAHLEKNWTYSVSLWTNGMLYSARRTHQFMRETVGINMRSMSIRVLAQCIIAC